MPSPIARSVLVLTGALFVALLTAVALVDLAPFEEHVRAALLDWASPPVLAAMRLANQAGDWRVLLPGTLLLFAVFRGARAQWWIWLALMLAAPALEGLFKEVIGRPRPEGLGFAFPSGHATAAAAYFGAVIHLAAELPPSARATLRAVAIVVIALVALARVLLRAHWPADVIGGVALGLALASAAALLASRRAGVHGVG